jgi:hypothetical protein
MGMFDYVRCEYELPEKISWSQNAWFQTKNLNKQLDHCRITKEGKLLRECRDHCIRVPQQHVGARHVYGRIVVFCWR